MKKILIFLFAAIISLNAGVKQLDMEPSNITEDMQIIDTRTPAEWKDTGTIKGAYKISLTKDDRKTIDENFIEKVKASGINLSRPIYVICKSGRRGEMAAKLLQENGINDVTNLKGGMDKLISHGYKTVKE